MWRVKRDRRFSLEPPDLGAKIALAGARVTIGCRDAYPASVRRAAPGPRRMATASDGGAR